MNVEALHGTDRVDGGLEAHFSSEDSQWRAHGGDIMILEEPVGSIHAAPRGVQYEPDSDCSVILRAPVDHTIRLTLTHLDTAPSRDFLYLHDGSDGDAPVLASDGGPGSTTCCTPNDARTSCVCPTGTYNSSLYGAIQCVEQDLVRNTEGQVATTCVSCDHLECVRTCSSGAIAVEPGWAFSSTSGEPTSPNIFRCPTESACIQTGDSICKQGHAGVLCALCERGYGKAGNECTKCSDVAQSHSYTTLILAVIAIIFGALVYQWRQSSRQTTADSVDTMMETHLDLSHLNG
jgi:hypothetical protein